MDDKEKIENLMREVELLKDQVKEVRELLKECYAIIHHKGAWLSMSDKNIEGLKKYLEKQEPKLVRVSDEGLWGV